MKKFLNRPETYVRESLEGMAMAYPDRVRVSVDPIFAYRADAPLEGKVAVVSGGGSGHEPTHAGYVGMGMLHAACPGEVFVSPSTDQIISAIRKVHGGAGVLNIVKCYWDDIEVFMRATEWAHTQGIACANILIDDDVALKSSVYSHGRRGTGTTVLAEKICGAASERWYDLKRLADLCRRVNANGRSVGVGLGPCTVPLRGVSTFEIGADEIEFGIGIHGERGRERLKISPADELAEMMALEIIEDPSYTRSVQEWDATRGEWVDVELTSLSFTSGDHILAFVNGMGGTPIPELYVIYRKLAEVCEKKGLTVERQLIGTYITAVEMQGASITLLRLDEEMVSLWDAPVRTPALRWGI